MTGLAVYDLEARSHVTATDAAIRNEGAQVRIGHMADRVERALSRVMRKALQCALYNMKAEDVAKWVGADLLQAYEVELREEQTDYDGTVYNVPSGRPIMVSDVWTPDLKKPQFIRDEIGIDIEPRSVRFSNPQQEVQDMQFLITKQMEFHKRITEAMLPQEKLAIAKAGNAALRLYLERLHIPNGEDMLYDLQDIVNIPPPMSEMTPPGGGGEGGGGVPLRAAGGPMTPQGAAAAAAIAQQLGQAPAMQPGQVQQQMRG